MYDAGHSTTIIEGPGGILYASTYPRSSPVENIGRVFGSSDAGANWIELGYGYFNSTTGISSLILASDGKLYAGSRPNGEVFSSTDAGATWSSTGILAGATIVYKMREVRKADSMFLYAATGPNGDVFRAFLYIYVGVNEETKGTNQATKITVMQNPVRGAVNIKLSGTGGELKIFDTAGKLVKNLSHKMVQGQWFRVRLEPGVYFVRFATENRSITKKLVVVE